MEEQTQAAPCRKVILHAHLAQYETTTQVAQSNQCQISSKDEATAMLMKDNRTNINQTKAQCQQTAHKKLQLEKQARSNKLRNTNQSSTVSDNESVAESTATIHQSNTRSGNNPTNKPQTLQQAIEGVSLPVFHGMLPRKYLY